jgi:hypothetical protein
MLNNGVLPGDLWPTQSDQELYAKFPRAAYHDIQWITAFESFVDDLVFADVLTQE